MMNEPQLIKVFTEWDKKEMSRIRRRLEKLNMVKAKNLTNDHVAEAQYLANASKYFKDKATETAGDLSENRSIQ